MNFKPTLTKKEIYRGDTPNPINLHFKNEEGEYIDMTGYSVWLTVRDKPAITADKTDVDAAISKEETCDSTGIVTFSLSNSDTDISPMTYYYDIQYGKTDSTFTRTIGIGEFVILAEVTRSR